MKNRSETRAWELPDLAVLPESQYLRRREFLRLFGYGLAASAVLPVTMRAASAGFPDSLNASFKLEGVKLTPEDSITSYNNFYEWGVAKDQPKEFANRGWKTRPWSLEIGGLCANPRKIDVDELIKLLGPIERRNSGIVASRLGRWLSRGTAFRWRNLSILRSQSLKRNI